VCEIKQSRTSSRRQTRGKMQGGPAFPWGYPFTLCTARSMFSSSSASSNSLDEDSLSADLRQGKPACILSPEVFNNYDFGFKNAGQPGKVASARIRPASGPRILPLEPMRRGFTISPGSDKYKSSNGFDVSGSCAATLFFCPQAVRRGCSSRCSINSSIRAPMRFAVFFR